LQPGDAAPVPIDARLTSIVIAYTNEAFIADQVAPRVPVGQQTFRYLKYNLADGFNMPETRVGRTSERNKVEFGGTESEATCENYALDDIVPIDDIRNAPEGYDPEGRAAEGVANLISLGHEIRTADLVFTSGNYATGYKATLSGTSQFSHVSSTPIATIQDAMDAMIMRPNVAVFGQAAWSKTRRNPELVSAILGNEGTKGMITREQFAALFELDEVLVGPGWINSAKKGQTATLARVWGKHLALICRDKLASTTNSRVTFAYTAQFGDKVARNEFSSKYGLNGAQVVTAGESVKELIPASNLGYLFTDAVA
jgi:hypothetical protein